MSIKRTSDSSVEGTERKCTHQHAVYSLITHSKMVWVSFSASSICSSIRKYGSTFYIGIAMVVLPYIGPMGKLKFQFSLSVSTQFDLYQHQSREHIES